MSETGQCVKWVSLIVMVVQNAFSIILMRYVRTLPGDMFYATTAIVCQEICKILLSFLFLFFELLSLRELCMQIREQIFNNLYDSVKTGVPAFLYTIQTNLIYLAISNLDAAVYQVTFQIKILTTALFMVVMLKRSLYINQWFSLLLLFIGVVVIQLQNLSALGEGSEKNKNAIFGLICVIAACVLSGLASVYFEKILKNSPVSLWVRNIQLGIFGTIFAFITTFLIEGKAIKSNGFFFGYNYIVWINVVSQSLGGLLVAIVIKYADNILKGFATSLAIIVSCVASVYLFNTQINSVFAIGTLLVVSSTLLYSYTPEPKKAIDTTVATKLEAVVVVEQSTLV